MSQTGSTYDWERILEDLRQDLSEFHAALLPEQPTQPDAEPHTPKLPAPTFSCSVCFDPITGVEAAKIRNDRICQHCFDTGLRPQFEQHYLSEYAPVLWAGRRVRFASVAHQFSEEFITSYKQRLALYSIPPKKRLYCAAPDCEEFLGRRSHHDGNVVCSACSETTCSKCSAHINSDFLDLHICLSPAERLHKRFGSQIRGRDYQLCPRCDVPTTLWDGCNHMSCPCGTQFCYLCGKKASAGSGHWNPGKPCTRYNRPPPLTRIPVPTQSIRGSAWLHAYLEDRWAEQIALEGERKV